MAIALDHAHVLVARQRQSSRPRTSWQTGINPNFNLCRVNHFRPIADITGIILSSRITFFASLLLFGGSVFALPIGHHSSSRAGRFLSHFTFERYGTNCIGANPTISFASRTANGYYFNPSPRSHPQLPTTWSVLNISTSTSGFWALTQTTTSASVQVHAVEDYQFTPDEPAQIRAAFLDQYVAAHPAAAAIAAHIRSVDGQIAAPIPLGYLHNCISLLSLLWLGICTATQRPWKWFKRRSSGHCRFCHYDLSATAPTFPCPECGSSQAQVTPA